MNHIATIARPARLLLVLPLSGCSLSPEIPVLGAAFPGWFFCLLGGAFLLIPCHILITRKGWQPRCSAGDGYHSAAVGAG
ncbi:hypothetical protein WN11_05870 [Klebsiella pneumoniae]|nr:hypothetical protein WN11_05870 [Klebsiella pneumoniae]